MQSVAPAERNCSDLCVLLAFLFCFVLESEALIHRDFLYIYIYILGITVIREVFPLSKCK